MCSRRGIARRSAATVSRAVEVLAAVAIAVDAEQHLGLDLGEAVDDAARRRSPASSRPDGADGGGGEESDDGLGDVRHVGDDTVALPDAERAQPAATARPGSRSSPQVSSSSSRSSEAWRIAIVPSSCRGTRARRSSAAPSGTSSRPASSAGQDRGSRRAGPRRSPRSPPRSRRGCDREPPEPRVARKGAEPALGGQPAGEFGDPGPLLHRFTRAARTFLAAGAFTIAQSIRAPNRSAQGSNSQIRATIRGR